MGNKKKAYSCAWLAGTLKDPHCMYCCVQPCTNSLISNVQVSSAYIPMSGFWGDRLLSRYARRCPFPTHVPYLSYIHNVLVYLCLRCAVSSLEGAHASIISYVRVGSYMSHVPSLSFIHNVLVGLCLQCAA